MVTVIFKVSVACVVATSEAVPFLRDCWDERVLSVPKALGLDVSESGWLGIFKGKVSPFWVPVPKSIDLWSRRMP